MNWWLKKCLYRLAHLIMGILIKRINVPEPELLTGDGSIKKLPVQLKKSNVRRVLIVTDKGISDLRLTSGLIGALKDMDIVATVFDLSLIHI